MTSAGAARLDVTGLPRGVIATFAAQTLALRGSTTLTLRADANVRVGSYPLKITATEVSSPPEYARMTSCCVDFRATGASMACWTRGKCGKYVMFIRFKSTGDVIFIGQGFNSNANQAVAGLRFSDGTSLTLAQLQDAGQLSDAQAAFAKAFARPGASEHVFLAGLHRAERTIAEETDWRIDDVKALASVVHNDRDFGLAAVSVVEEDGAECAACQRVEGEEADPGGARRDRRRDDASCRTRRVHRG